MAKAGVFVNVVGKVDTKAFERARQELRELERTSTTASDRIAGRFAAAGRKIGQVGERMSQAGGTLSTRVTLPLIGAGVASFKLASDLNESISKANVVFDEQARTIQRWSKTAATGFGMSRQEALESASTLGNLFRSMELGTKPAAKMSTKIVGLAGDLASFNNANPQDVLEALRSGLVGETEPLRKFGVSISAARIEAEALQLGLAKAPVDMAKVAVATTSLERAQLAATKATKKFGAGSLEARTASAKVAAAQSALNKAMAGSKVELTAAQKAQATYSLIMRDTKLAQGDFARTSGGAANQTRILTARLKDTAAAFGTQLLPIGLKVLGWAQSLLTWFTKLSPEIQHFILIGAGIVAALGPALTIFGKITQVIGGIVGIAGKVIKVVGLVGQAFVKLGVVMMANPVVAIIALFVALGVALFVLYKKNERFRRLVDSVWRKIRGAIAAAWDKIRPVLETLGRFITDTVVPLIAAGLNFVRRVFLRYTAPIRAFWSKFGDEIIATTQTAFRLIVKVVQVAFGVIAVQAVVAFGILRRIFDVALGAIRFVWNAVGDDIVRIVRLAFGFIIGSVRNAFNFIRGLFEFFINLILGKWGAAWDGLKRMLAAVFSQFRNIVGTGFRVLRSIFAAALGLIGRIFAGAWRWLTRQAGRGINAIVDFFVKLPGRLVAGVGNVGQFVWNAIRGGFNLLKTGVRNTVNGVIGFFRDLPGNLVRFAGRILTAATKIGGKILKGIGDGLAGAADVVKNIAGAVFEALKSIWNKLVGFIADGFDEIRSWANKKIPFADPVPDLGGFVRDHLHFAAHGAVVDRPSLWMVGENRATSPEVIAPVKMLRRLLAEQMRGSSPRAGGTKVERLLRTIISTETIPTPTSARADARPPAPRLSLVVPHDISRGRPGLRGELLARPGTLVERVTTARSTDRALAASGVAVTVDAGAIQIHVPIQVTGTETDPDRLARSIAGEMRTATDGAVARLVRDLTVTIQRGHAIPAA